MPSSATALPPDIEEIWGKDRRDTFGNPVDSLAACLIKEWGLEEFRNSAVHKAAQAELRLAGRKDECVKRFLKSSSK